MTRNFCWLTRVCAALAVIVLGSDLAQANLSFPAARTKDGRPDRRRGAGSRSLGESCFPQILDDTGAKSEKVQFALAPVSNNVLTTSAAPSFFWYMPEVTNASVVFELSESATQKPLYKTVLLASGKEGLAQLTLPSSAGASLLEKGKRYDWSVLIVCNPEAGFDPFATDSPSVTYRFTSQIELVAAPSELTVQLQTASGLQQAELYAESGLWENSLAAIAQASCFPDSRDASLAALTELLASVELAYFAQIPFLNESDCADPSPMSN